MIQDRSSKHRLLGSEPWASLPQDLLELIAWRVLAGDLLDYVRFRAVCSHWNSSTVPPRGRGLVDPRFHPRRWMLFPEGYGLYPGHPNLGNKGLIMCAAIIPNWSVKPNLRIIGGDGWM
ncbi:hypothetical protein SEVIR_5G380101v4 [Setaria viridis]